jgi:hypothetical protein
VSGAGAEAVEVDLPLRGEWAALHTPAERVPSHGSDFLGQAFAFDFIRVHPRSGMPYERGFWRHLLSAQPAAAFLAWDQPVHAAEDGEVVACSDGWPDRPRMNLVHTLLESEPSPAGDDLRPLAGNHVIVAGPDAVALYAHLRSGSVAVRRGGRVRRGEHLGRVGNSGSSTQPHLHFHLMDDSDPLRARGVPCRFRLYERWEGERWVEVRRGVPAALERIRLLPDASSTTLPSPREAAP